MHGLSYSDLELSHMTKAQGHDILTVHKQSLRQIIVSNHF